MVRRTPSFPLDFCVSQAHTSANRFSEEQFLPLGRSQHPQKRTVVSWIEPKSARIQLATLALTREAHDENSLAASLFFPS
jgi:hypothetical protein